MCSTRHGRRYQEAGVVGEETRRARGVVMVVSYGRGRLDAACARRLIAAAALSSLLGGSLACGDAKKLRPVRRSSPSTEPVVAPMVARAANTEPVVVPPAARPADEDNRPPAASFRVEGVAADDVLNIRSKPDANSRVLGSIPPQERRVEGLGAPTTVARSTWQRVRYAGVTGWVNARFLRANVAGPPSHEATGVVESGNLGGWRRVKDKAEP
jgi:hypothetical protein